MPDHDELLKRAGALLDRLEAVFSRPGQATDWNHIAYRWRGLQEYLQIVDHWLHRLGGQGDENTQAEALRWALRRGSRSGRVAWQFARDQAGRTPHETSN